METFRFIYTLVRPYLRYYLAGIILIPPSTFCALAVPRLTGTAVDRLGQDASDLQPVYVLGGLILLFALGRGLCLFGTRMLLIGSSRWLEFDLRNRLFAHLQSLDRRFYDNARTGDLMARSSTDVDAVRTVAGPCILYTASTLFMLALAIPLMASVDLVLTGLVLVPLTMLTVAVRIVGPRVQKSYLRAQETLSEISSFAQENFGGMRVVKSFAVEDRETDSFRDLCDLYYDRNLATERIYNWMGPIVGAVGEVAVILLLLVGGRMMLSGDFTLGDFVKFAGYQSLLIWPMISVGWVVNQVHRGVASVGRLEEVLAARSTVADPVPAVPPAGAPSGEVSAPPPAITRGEIEFRDLTFSYGGRAVLQGISFRVPAGKTVAILGRTGSGKSTLVSLIPRLYRVPDGAIFIDGIDVNRIPLPALRRAIGFVPQETFLFSRTIAENIGFRAWGDGGWPGAEEIGRFAEISRLDKDVDQFAGGYQEVVGERGVTLSGGQKQRVAISRALIGSPRILILDDALSAVDTHTEEEILANLRRATHDLTVLIVSHRISSIQDADRIYVLDGGRIVEQGTHAELVRRGGLYAETFRMQQLAEELEQM